MHGELRRVASGLPRERLALHAIVAVIVGGAATGPLRAEDTDRAPLPPCALARIGTDDLRTRGHIHQLAFSPDGRLIAAAENDELVEGKILMFDVKTGRPVKRVKPTDPADLLAFCFAFSPDGTKLAWSDVGGNVMLWDLVGDRLLDRGQLHKASVTAVAFSPDGRVIASGGSDGAVHLRSVEVLAAKGRTGANTGQPAANRLDRDLIEDRWSIHRLAFTPDGTRLVVGNLDGVWASLAVWRLSDGKMLRRIDRAHGPYEIQRNSDPMCLAVTPDGRRILSSGLRNPPEKRIQDGQPKRPLCEIRTWDIETGERILDLRDEESSGQGHVAWSPDGRRMAVADRDSLRILDAATGRPERTIVLPGCESPAPAFSPDGTMIAMSVSNTIYLYDAQTGRRLVQDDSTPARELERVAWSPAGDRIVTGHADGIVRAWNVATGELIWHKAAAAEAKGTGGGSRVSFVAFSSDGQRAIVAGHRDDRVHDHDGFVTIYNAASGMIVHEVQDEGFGEAAMSPDGRMMFGDRWDRRTHDLILVGIEAETGRELWRAVLAKAKVRLPDSVSEAQAVHFRSDSNVVEVAMLGDAIVQFDARNGRERRRVSLDPPASLSRGPGQTVLLRAPVFRADGRMAVAQDLREWISVWDVDTGKLRQEIPRPRGYGSSSCLSPDGRTLATVTYSGGQDAIRLYDLATGQEVLALQLRDEGARLLQFSPDGTKLFTGFDRGSGVVWGVRYEQNGARAR